MGQARDLAKRHTPKVGEKADRALLADLSFKGISPEHMVTECLSALSIRNELAHTFNGDYTPTEKDLKQLLELCKQLEELT